MKKRTDFVTVTECDDLYHIGKVLTNDDMVETINGNYNNMNEKEYVEITETTEDPNSIYII